MRFLIRLSAPGLSREAFLDSVRRLASSVGAEVRNPKWTSYGALELDVFLPRRPDFELFLTAAAPLYSLEFSHDLNEAAPFKSDEEAIKEAKNYFNSERYWECHEVLEGLWRTKKGQEKLFLQGIILVCAAYVHHQKGEDEVGLGVLERANKQLSYSTADYHGVDVELLGTHVKEILNSRKFSTFTI